MDGKKILAGQFEANRAHLRAVAGRLLGASGDAEDAVQEAWMRLERADTSDVRNLRAWLTTVVARACLDMLRARKTRREESIELAGEMSDGRNAAEQTELSDSIGVAMLVVLETLSPAERVAFVLHDMFGMAFDDIAPLVSRSSDAARQLASRARRRLHGASTSADADRARRAEVVQAFLAASRAGDFTALLDLLDPDVVLRSDAGVIAASLASLGDTPNLSPEIRGREAVAERFRGRARAAQPALVDGEPGLVIAPGGVARMVFDFVIEEGSILEISLIANPETVAALAPSWGGP
jgi:RNA polymerase sigma factor (sigma-70 family)